jgi:hypothetical protein
MTSRSSVVSLVGILLLCVGPGDGVAGQDAAGGAVVSVLVPHESWPCGLPGGIPTPESGTLVLEARMTLDRVLDVGNTPYGWRQVAVVREGTVSGPRFAGSVATGALDFELRLTHGVIEIEQVFVFRTSNDRYVLVRSTGTGPDAGDVRLVMDFEAPTASDAAWLNSGAYVARRTLDAAARTMTLRVFDVSTVKASAGSTPVVRIAKLAGVPTQPLDYRRADPSETRGPEVITETVTLSPSQWVGASKRGNRNIFPITGGELKGRISGRVVPGGADYQLLAKPATIDARYLWETADGEIIIVRNGGAFGSLVPTFEVRVDSEYAWLNTGLFLSSNPGTAPGGVGLTFYESTPLSPPRVLHMLGLTAAVGHAFAGGAARRWRTSLAKR